MKQLTTTAHSHTLKNVTADGDGTLTYTSIGRADGDGTLPYTGNETADGDGTLTYTKKCNS
jgi:hypothetical protein